MSTFRALIKIREARAALAAWVAIPTLFLFFAMTLAVDPGAHVAGVRIGAVVLDQGIDTPKGPVSIGAALAGGLQEKLGLEVVPYPSETDLRTAVLAREVAGGLVVPQGATAGAVAGTTVQLKVVRSDANDPFSNAFTTSIVTQLNANIAALLPVLTGAADAPAGSPVLVVPDTVAVSPDFRFAAVPGSLVLPFWIATLLFAALVTRAAAELRSHEGPAKAGLAELLLAVVAGGVVALVVTLGIALFALRTDFDLVGLFAILWLGLAAMAWLIQGTMRLLGLVPGAVLALLALFVQQPVSGAAYPASFAPDVVRWAEPVAPLRYLVEGIRDALVGGSTMPAMAGALAVLAAAGIVLYLAGLAVASARQGRGRLAAAAPVY